MKLCPDHPVNVNKLSEAWAWPPAAKVSMHHLLHAGCMQGDYRATLQCACCLHALPGCTAHEAAVMHSQMNVCACRQTGLGSCIVAHFKPFDWALSQSAQMTAPHRRGHGGRVKHRPGQGAAGIISVAGPDACTGACINGMSDRPQNPPQRCWQLNQIELVQAGRVMLHGASTM